MLISKRVVSGCFSGYHHILIISYHFLSLFTNAIRLPFHCHILLTNETPHLNNLPQSKFHTTNLATHQNLTYLTRWERMKVLNRCICMDLISAACLAGGETRPWMDVSKLMLHFFFSTGSKHFSLKSVKVSIFCKEKNQKIWILFHATSVWWWCYFLQFPRCCSVIGQYHRYPLVCECPRARCWCLSYRVHDQPCKTHDSLALPLIVETHLGHIVMIYFIISFDIGKVSILTYFT